MAATIVGAAQPLQMSLPRVESVGVGRGAPPGAGGAGVGAAEQARGGGFAERVRELVETTDARATRAEELAAEYAAGRQNDLHGTMIAAAEADVQLRLLANVRNRAIEAYREIMRMGA
jgi:flagellar hook-basal body complex protein FliE